MNPPFGFYYNVIVQGFPLKNVCHYHAIFQFVVQWGEQSINGNLLSCPRAQRLGNSSYAKTSQETSLKGEGDWLTLTACRRD